MAGQPHPNIRVFQRGARRYANFRGEQKGGGTRLAAVCRPAEQRRIKVEGRGGMEFLNLIEVSRDFFFLGMHGNKYWWNIIESG